MAGNKDPNHFQKSQVGSGATVQINQSRQAGLNNQLESGNLTAQDYQMIHQANQVKK